MKRSFDAFEEVMTVCHEKIQDVRLLSNIAPGMLGEQAWASDPHPPTAYWRLTWGKRVQHLNWWLESHDPNASRRRDTDLSWTLPL